MVAVFPAPFDPRYPQISPDSTSKESPSPASAFPYRSVDPSSSIATMAGLPPW